ncbi:MAG: formate dehydrogenase accessory sulfurtransferase FdhD [Planctomycetes bacterium]|nr:formate dehydrogenase accessory sulfurtransferase FdhD [Planctomycetota bacterium]
MTDPTPEGAHERRLASGQADRLVREEPLLLVIDGQQLLTMRTPGHDHDLALGFLLGEGIVRTRHDVADMKVHAGDPALQQAEELHVTFAHRPGELQRSRLVRTHEIRSSCGVCGVADPATILDGTPALLPGVPKVGRAMIGALVETLRRRQDLFAATGGSHGALIAGPGGEVRGFGEDVGRHNALDKAIGEAARSDTEFCNCIAVLSGRAGFDLVVKCLRVQIPIVVSVSAPSALAFDLCHGAGATLIGFARGDRQQVYCGAERLTD